MVEEDKFVPIEENTALEFRTTEFDTLTTCGCQINVETINGTPDIKIAAFEPDNTNKAKPCNSSTLVLNTTTLVEGESYLLNDSGKSNFNYFFRLKKASGSGSPMVLFHVACYGNAKYSGNTLSPTFSILVEDTFYGVEVPDPTEETGEYITPCGTVCPPPF